MTYNQNLCMYLDIILDSCTYKECSHEVHVHHKDIKQFTCNDHYYSIQQKLMHVFRHYFKLFLHTRNVCMRYMYMYTTKISSSSPAMIIITAYNKNLCMYLDITLNFFLHTRNVCMRYMYMYTTKISSSSPVMIIVTVTLTWENLL